MILLVMSLMLKTFTFFPGGWWTDLFSISTHLHLTRVKTCPGKVRVMLAAIMIAILFCAYACLFARMHAHIHTYISDRIFVTLVMMYISRTRIKVI